MLGFVWRQLRAAGPRSLVTGLAVLVASAGFVTLTSAVSTTSLSVHQLASSHYRPAYDILVRPNGSKTAFEKQHHLVAANYLGGTYGGITTGQWHRIEHMDGVAVAAPIANVGYLSLPVRITIPVPKDSSLPQLYRVKLAWSTDNGLSRIPGPVDYVYVTDEPFGRDTSGPVPIPRVYQTGPDGKKLYVCAHYRPHRGPRSPLDPISQMSCHSTATPDVGNSAAVSVLVQFPVLLAGIDPGQEATLMDLPGALTAGDYLTEGAGLSAPVKVGESGGPPMTMQRVPVLAATSTFVDETLTGSITALNTPPDGFATLLGSQDATDRLGKLDGHTVRQVRVDGQDGYGKLLATLPSSGNGGEAHGNVYVNTLGIAGFWSVGPAGYRQLGDRHVAARTTSNPTSVWGRIRGGNNVPAPPGSGDTQFHRATPHLGDPSNFGLHAPPGADSDTNRKVGLQVVGKFDPGKLPGFSALNKVPLQTYYPPTVTGATDHDRTLLGGKPLGPDLNLGGYVTQPPLLLTTITAAAQMQNPLRYSNGHPDAPISSIRIRVAGVTGLNAESTARVKQVAERIATATGLDVQITAGSSPTPVTVDLAAGKYGRPSLQVTQNWIQQGAASTLTTSVDAESLGLFILVLVAAVLLLAGGINATVRARRHDLGVLAALGWTPRQLARAIRLEVLTIAAAAGVVGIGAAALLVWLLGLTLPWAQTVLVLPAALIVALLAAWWPARAAGRADPTLTLTRRVTRRRRGRTRRIRHLAWAAVARRPSRAVLGGLGLAIGIAAITVLLAIELRFQGQVSKTLIGQVAILHVHGAELAAAVLVAVFGAATVADIVALDLAERAGEFAALAATGWSRAQLARLAAGQGLILGTFGALAGAIAGFIIATILTATPGFVALTALAGLIGGTLLALLATAIPVTRTARRQPAPVLAGNQ